MIIAPFLAKACQELDKAMQGTLDGTKIACISETISGYAIAAAIASGMAGVAPGFAGVAAALTQAGFVWATYVKINKTLDISMSENTAKFIGSAIVTNLIQVLVLLSPYSLVRQSFPLSLVPKLFL